MTTVDSFQWDKERRRYKLDGKGQKIPKDYWHLQKTMAKK